MFPQNIHFLDPGQNLDLNLTLPHTHLYRLDCLGLLIKAILVEMAHPNVHFPLMSSMMFSMMATSVVTIPNDTIFIIAVSLYCPSNIIECVYSSKKQAKFIYCFDIMFQIRTKI